MSKRSINFEESKTTFGNGNGYGNGDGSGDEKDFMSALAVVYASRWPNKQRSRLVSCQRNSAVIAYWKSDAAGRPANGGSGCAVQAGTVQEITGPLVLCGNGALHATLSPHKWKGERTWIVALFGQVIEDNDKFGALKREILGEVKELK